MAGKVILSKSTAVHIKVCRLLGGQSRPCVDYIDEELGFVDKHQAKASFRDQILKKWGYKCAYCREHLDKTGTLDHVRPKSKGGQTSVSNLIAACSNCNMRKSSNDWKDWFRMQEFWRPHLEDAICCWLSQ
jgi:5-methylcytosine-specific restriction endonuclease McrA